MHSFSDVEKTSSTIMAMVFIELQRFPWMCLNYLSPSSQQRYKYDIFIRSDLIDENLKLKRHIEQKSLASRPHIPVETSLILWSNRYDDFRSIKTPTLNVAQQVSRECLIRQTCIRISKNRVDS